MTHTTTYEYLDADTVAGILDLMDGDTEMVVDLIDTLAESNPELLEELTAGVETGDAGQIREAAHSLKSSNAQLGALVFSGICLQMETAGKTANLSEAAALLPKIQVEYQKVASALESWKTQLLK